MTYKRLIIGDASVGRYWQVVQSARPRDLGEVVFKPASCYDTLETALDFVSDELDYVVFSVVTSILTDECNASDVKASAINVIDGITKRIFSCAKKSKHCQVCCTIIFFFRGFFISVN